MSIWEPIGPRWFGEFLDVVVHGYLCQLCRSWTLETALQVDNILIAQNQTIDRFQLDAYNTLVAMGSPPKMVPHGTENGFTWSSPLMTEDEKDAARFRVYMNGACSGMSGNDAAVKVRSNAYLGRSNWGVVT